jgi:hypothetical protein
LLGGLGIAIVHTVARHGYLILDLEARHGHLALGLARHGERLIVITTGAVIKKSEVTFVLLE